MARELLDEAFIVSPYVCRTPIVRNFIENYPITFSKYILALSAAQYCFESGIVNLSSLYQWGMTDEDIHILSMFGLLKEMGIKADDFEDGEEVDIDYEIFNYAVSNDTANGANPYVAQLVRK